MRELPHAPASQARRLLRFLLEWHHSVPTGSGRRKWLLFRILPSSSPGRAYDDVRGPNMMMAMPARLTAAPSQSVGVGRMPSTAHNQRIATPM